jgi:hypothetical protein
VDAMLGYLKGRTEAENVAQRLIFFFLARRSLLHTVSRWRLASHVHR